MFSRKYPLLISRILTTITENNVIFFIFKMLPNLSKMKHNFRIKHINVSITNALFFHKNMSFLS